MDIWLSTNKFFYFIKTANVEKSLLNKAGKLVRRKYDFFANPCKTSYGKYAFL